MTTAPVVSRLHYELVRGLIERGACPANAELARRLGVPPAEIEVLLHRLADLHGVVLHPHVCEPWIVHPFSLTPTIHWVEGSNGSWWAPCVWCAFGIAVLVGGEVRIHTRFAAEAEPLLIHATDGAPHTAEDVWVHFAIPPARAWDNVHEHCALVLPFRSPGDIRDWCDRHHLPHGQAVPLDQVADFARRWYGTHGNENWHKWSVAQAREIFHRSGFQSEFWDLGAKAGRY